jgi:predicted DNA-binding transcriptional regulator AlpA
MTNESNKQPKPIPAELNDLRVLTLQEIAALEGVSFATLKRLIAVGLGPKTIQLSVRRVGVRVCDYRAWQEERLRAA